VSQHIFDGLVSKYSGNKYVKHFSCWNQLLVMMFGQLGNRERLRDVMPTMCLIGDVVTLNDSSK